jgi:hypothetical protein
VSRGRFEGRDHVAAVAVPDEVVTQVEEPAARAARGGGLEVPEDGDDAEGEC